MRSWITSFNNELHAKTTRWAMIYTTTDWWTTCTGNSERVRANNPLWHRPLQQHPGHPAGRLGH